MKEFGEAAKGKTYSSGIRMKYLLQGAELQLKNFGDEREREKEKDKISSARSANSRWFN